MVLSPVRLCGDGEVVDTSLLGGSVAANVEDRVTCGLALVELHDYSLPFGSFKITNQNSLSRKNARGGTRTHTGYPTGS